MFIILIFFNKVKKIKGLSSYSFYSKVRSMKSETDLLHILIIVKVNNSGASLLGVEITNWLYKKGHHTTLLEDISNIDAYSKTIFDFIIVLGGDGTMLRVARAFVDNPTPLIGVNFGRVGFLAELSINTWKAGLLTILEKKHSLVKRTALGWNIFRENKILYSGYAINDVVVNRGALSRVITLDVCVEAEPISTIRADGIIFSSPVGSTGYAVSAGGPLVHPANNILLVTAICPYLCNFPAMVLPHTMPVSVTLHQAPIETFAAIDGQENYALKTNDSVEVFCIPDAVYFIRIGAEHYFTPLRKRGFIHGLH